MATGEPRSWCRARYTSPMPPAASRRSMRHRPSRAGTGAAWATTNVPSAGLAAPGGTGGIVVDNTSASTGASQVYFSQLQAGGNAIQASQATLD